MAWVVAMLRCTYQNSPSSKHLDSPCLRTGSGGVIRYVYSIDHVTCSTYVCICAAAILVLLATFELTEWKGAEQCSGVFIRFKSPNSLFSFWYGVTPIAGWLISWKIQYIKMYDLGVPPFLGTSICQSSLSDIQKPYPPYPGGIHLGICEDSSGVILRHLGENLLCLYMGNFETWRHVWLPESSITHGGLYPHPVVYFTSNISNCWVDLEANTWKWFIFMVEPAKGEGQAKTRV